MDTIQELADEFLGDDWLDKEGPVDARSTLIELLRSVRDAERERCASALMKVQENIVLALMVEMKRGEDGEDNECAKATYKVVIRIIDDIAAAIREGDE